MASMVHGKEQEGADENEGPRAVVRKRGGRLKEGAYGNMEELALILTQMAKKKTLSR